MSTKKLKTDKITNELEGASAFFSQKLSEPQADNLLKTLSEGQKHGDRPKTGATASVSDVATPHSDVTDTGEHIDAEKLTTVIRAIAEIPVGAQNTPVRLSVQEKKDIEEFIYGRLRKSGLQGKGVSASKLLRYALRYLMKVHERAFIDALGKALTKKSELPI